MSLALRMTTVAVALAIAGGAGYWLARVQQGAAPAAAAGAVAAAAPAAHGPGEGAGLVTGEGAGGNAAGGASGGERQILYYRNPMGLPDTSPVPKKDSMGMDYIAVYADDRPDDSGAVAVSPARIQTLGVKTALVEQRTVDATVRASGRIEIDERRQVGGRGDQGLAGPGRRGEHDVGPAQPLQHGLVLVRVGLEARRGHPGAERVVGGVRTRAGRAEPVDDGTQGRGPTLGRG